ADGAPSGAVVLCPPMQFEYYASHAAFRLLAESLAASGVAALRLDYTATGDSAGLPSAVDDVALWLDDIRAAVAMLRGAGAPTVGLIGMRMGATLAASAEAGADFEVAWDPCLTGRRYLREATLLARAVVEDSPEMLEALEQDRVQIIGYDFPVSFAESVSALRMPSTGPVSRPTLLLTRDGEIPKGLQSWVGPLMDVGVAEGQEQLVVPQLDRAVAPTGTITAITEWCVRAAGSHRARLSPAVSPVVEIEGPYGHRVTERVTRVGRSGLFAISTEPLGPPRLTLACFNSGAQHRVGPNRLHVETARLLAPEGVRTIRLDVRTVGDSPGIEQERTSLYWPPTIDDVEDVVADLSLLPEPVALAGLCSGAYHSLEAASRLPVRGVFAIHPVLDLGTMNNRTELADGRRRIWMRDRGWVRTMNRYDALRAIKWHIPSWCWALADRLRIQPEPTTGIRAIAGRGDTEVVLVMEVSWRENRRLYRLKKAPFGALTIESCVGDHALVSISARREVQESLIRHALSWRGPAI
ncbi:MAG TPA: alpha/beta fold hydrolase, partial [Acidimicrobiales bacterium]|nr:alpha/beta fold hydrolase [Acidimicrobiales bacterium]